MNYQKHYDLLMERARNRSLEGYSERHHVVPRCLGGTDEPDNLVRLTPEEHYVAHQLLTKIYPGNQKLIFAAWAMTMNGSKRQNKKYGWLKLKKSRAQSERQKGKTKENDEGVAKSAESRSGKTKENDPRVAIRAAKQSKTMKGRTKETHPGIAESARKKRGRTKENDPGVMAMAIKLTGRTKENDSSVAAGADKQRGRTKETHDGVAKSAKTRKGRTKETHDYLAISSQKQKGRTKETHDYLAKHSEKMKSLPNDVELWVYNEKVSGIKNVTIHKKLIELGFKVSYSIVSKIYARLKPTSAVKSLDDF